MLTLFAGPICEGIECAPLYLVIFLYASFPYLMGIALIVLVAQYFRLKKRKGNDAEKKRRVVGGLFIVLAALSALMLLAAYSDHRKTVNEKKEAASQFSFDPYDVTYVPPMLANLEKFVGIEEFARFEDPHTKESEIHRKQNYTQLYYSYSREQGYYPYKISQFSKRDINPNDGDCGRYDPRSHEFLSIAPEGQCSQIGKNKFGTAISKFSVNGESGFITDMGNTRITIFWYDALEPIPDHEAIAMIDGLKRVEPVEIPFSY